MGNEKINSEDITAVNEIVGLLNKFDKDTIERIVKTIAIFYGLEFID